MVDLIQLGTAIAIVFIAAAATIIRSLRGGTLGNVLDKRRRKRADGGGDRVNGKLDDIRERVEDTYESTEENGEKIDHVAEAMVMLHRDDDDVKEQELRRKVGVDSMDDDFLTREGRSDD